MPKWTPGPWHWWADDYSMATLSGKGDLEDHVMSVIPCNSCQKRAEEDGKWKWGRCTTPNEANAKLIAKAPEMVELLKDTVRWLSDTAPIGFSEPLTAAKALLKEIDDDPG